MSLNFLEEENVMTTFIDPFEQEIISRDMPPSASFVLTLFIGTCVGGLYIYDMYKKQKEYEKKIDELESKYTAIARLQDEQEETLEELDQRLREKKDFDSDEEIQEKKYQAWCGYSNCNADNVDVEISIWREKLSTQKKNNEWVSSSETSDASCTVRDFYLGNSSPEFEWQFDETTHSASVNETMVNGWDSVIKIKIGITHDANSPVSVDDSFHKKMNSILKQCMKEDTIEWSRILIDA